MSYVRWSSNCFQSDVYVFEDIRGGWTTMVAERRYHPLKPCPEPTSVNMSDFDAWLAYSNACDAWVNDESNWEWQDINHPDAGSSSNDNTIQECIDRLVRYQKEGLVVPQSAFDTLAADDQS